jgi:hypothetical protein
MRTLLHSTCLLLLAVASCAPLGRRTGAGFAEEVPVVVENQNFYQATIYALVNSSRIRLGEVHGNSSATFSVRAPATGQLSVEIRLLAVGVFTSYPVSVVPGDTVQIRVPPDLHLRGGRPR